MLPGDPLKLIATLVGIVSGIVGLLFLFVPDWRPGDGAKDGRLEDITFIPSMTLGEYLARIDQPRDDFAEEQLQRRGAFVQFRVHAVGYKGRPLVLKWELFDRDKEVQRAEERAFVLTPKTNDEQSRPPPFWIPLPNDRGTYFVVIEMLLEQEPVDAELDELQTPEFRGAG
jgi:hypothetical protein